MSSPSQKSAADSYLRAPLEKLHALPEHSHSRAISRLPTQAERDLVPPEDARFKQHRCFPRLSDAAHAVGDFDLPLGAFFSRALVLARCLRSAEGDEPREPALLRAPEDYALRYRPGRGPTTSGR